MGDCLIRRSGSSVKAIYLGEGKSFDVKSTYPNYSSLTADDFFITPTESTSLKSSSTSCRSWDSSGTRTSDHCLSPGSTSVTMSFTKSYSNGVLTCSYADANVKAWLIPTSNALIQANTIKSLGTAETFTVTSVASDYSKCTKNNFLLRTIPNTSAEMTYCYSTSCGLSAGFEKTYSTNGSLTMHNVTSRSFKSGSSGSVSPYYIPTSILS